MIDVLEKGPNDDGLIPYDEKMSMIGSPMKRSTR